MLYSELLVGVCVQVVGLGPDDVATAFAALGAGAETGLLTHRELGAQLMEKGESLGGEELEQCWEALLGR
eukprot:SAG11_NODE_1795_length_4248_cov_6.202699_1_plen_70_part_00